MDSRTRVLLVEDDERLAALMSEFLTQNGLEVQAVADGAEALREVEKTAFDAMVLDIMLPVLDGYSVCQRVRERQTLPILMITARTAELDRVMGLELGADDYITKPLSMRELLARIRAVVRRARGQVGPAANALQVGELRADF